MRTMLRHAGRTRLALAAAAMLTAALTGCQDIPVERYNETQKQLLEAQEKVKTLEAELAAQQQAQRNIEEQLAELRGSDAALTDLVYPVKIELERMSGGYDRDGQPGHDGIVLYVQPIDADGNVIKAAGTINVKLFDLAAPADSTLIAEYRFDAKKTRSLWYGRLMTQHFTVHCPWPNGKPPAHSQVTAVVTFTDLLTGKPLTTQNVYEIQFPARRDASARH